MKTYSHTLSDLCEILHDAINLADDSETLKEKLKHISVNRLVSLSEVAKTYSTSEKLTRLLMELNLFSDESGNRRRNILATPDFEYQRGSFNTTHYDVLSSFGQKAACSFLFVNQNKKFIHAYFIIDKASNKVIKVSFNETLCIESKPEVIGGVSCLNDVEHGYKILTQYE